MPRSNPGGGGKGSGGRKPASYFAGTQTKGSGRAAPKRVTPKPAPKPAGKPARVRLQGSMPGGPGGKQWRKASVKARRKENVKMFRDLVAGRRPPKIPKYVAAPKPPKPTVKPKDTLVKPTNLRGISQAERRPRVVARQQQVRRVNKDKAYLLRGVANPTTKNVLRANEAGQRLRDAGVLPGKSHSKAALRREFKAIDRWAAEQTKPKYPVEKAISQAFQGVIKGRKNIPGMNGGGKLKVGGVDIAPTLKASSSPVNPQGSAAAALVAAENLTRISSAEGKAATEAIRAIKRGKSLGKTAEAYVKGAGKGFVENKSSWGDALREVGASKGAAAGIGFVMDVVLDPTTYVTLGIPTAGRAAARAAGEAAGRAAVKRGASKAVALREIRAAMRGEEAVVSPGAARMRGNIGGRMRARTASLEFRGESKAITEQRSQLADLERRGQGQSRKAQNIRRNLDRAGKRTENRVELAKSRAGRSEQRASDAASVVGADGQLKIRPPRRGRLFASKGSQRARARNIIRPASTEAKTTFSRIAERQVENSAKGQRVDPVLSIRFGRRRVADIPLEPFSKGTVKNSGKVGKDARSFFGGVAPGIRSDKGLAERAFAGARQASRDERSGRGTAEVNAVLNMKAVERATGRIDDADKELWVAVWERSDNPATRVRVKDGSLVFGSDDALRGVPPAFAERYLVKTRRRGYQLRGVKRVNDVVTGAERRVEKSGQPVGDALKMSVVRESDVQAAEESLRVARAARKKAKAEADVRQFPDGETKEAAKKKIEQRTVPEREYDPTPSGINGRKFYHGTNTNIRRRQVDATMGDSDSLFGPGFYLTDNPEIAAGYARAAAKGKKPKRPILHEVELNVHKPLDLEAKPDKKLIAALEDLAHDIDVHWDESVSFSWPLEGTMADEIKYVLGLSNPTNALLLEHFVEVANRFGSSFVDELMQNLQFRLMEDGFDALVHIGGGRVGKTRHQVVILLGPKGINGRLGANAAGKMPPPMPNAIRSMRQVGKRYSTKSAEKAQANAEKAAAQIYVNDWSKASKKAKTANEQVKDAKKNLDKLKSSRVFADDEEMASRYYPRRPAADQKMPYEEQVDYIPPNMNPESVGQAAAQQEGARVLGNNARGNLMSRTDPRPQDVGNAERLVSDSASVRPKMGANPAQDVATYGLNMERVAAYNDGVRRLAESGRPAKLKAPGEETLDEFYQRNGMVRGQAESVGKKVYELGVRGEGAGRYDLREIEPEILEQLVTGKAPGGEPTKLKRVGQYVVLDERAVARFRQFRSAEVLAPGVGTRIWDRLGGRLRQLAIFTPMYQAINEMGDTWIMYTVVPGYKVPFYKSKALPVVRYLQAAEAGNRRVMREIGDAEIMVGSRFMKVKDVARIARKEGTARQGVFAKTVEVTNPEVRQVTKAGKPKGRIANAAADRFASSDPALQFAVTAPKRGAQSMGRFFRSREDWNRVATWLYFQDEGYTSEKAVQDSLEALIDYGELSQFERNYARRLAFFYTFPARQIPYQTKALFRRPGKLAAYEKLRVAAADYQGVNLSDLYAQPWYVQANVPIPLRINGEVRWVSANLPFNMLNQSLPVGSNWPVFGKGGLFQRDIDFALSSLNPLLRAPVEDIANRNFFYRTSIEDERGMSANETPAPWFVVKLVQAAPMFQKSLGVYYKETRTSAGKKIWVMDKKWAWRLSQLAYGPLRIPASAGKFRNERGQTWTDDLFRFGTGIRVDRDMRVQQRTSKIFERLSAIQEELNKMRGDSRFEGKARWIKLQAEQKKLKAEQKKLGKQMGLTWAYGEQRPSSKKPKSDVTWSSGSGFSGGGFSGFSGGGFQK